MEDILLLDQITTLIVIGEVVSEFDETAIQTLTQNYVNSTIVDGRAGILRITLDGNLDMSCVNRLKTVL